MAENLGLKIKGQMRAQAGQTQFLRSVKGAVK
jgi:hypothetical protein